MEVNSKNIDCYLPGKILTFKELKGLKIYTIIHIHYLDEYDYVRVSDFYMLSKDCDQEWSAGGFPFPIRDLENNTLLKNCDNSGWSFMIREAIKSKKGVYKKKLDVVNISINALKRMQVLHEEIRFCTDEEFKILKKKVL